MIDSGVLRNTFLKSRPEQGKLFLKSLEIKNFFKSDILLMKSSPFILMEVLGISLNQINNLIMKSSFNKIMSNLISSINEINYNEKIDELMNLFIKEFEKTPHLQLQIFLEKYNKVKEYRCEIGQSIFDKLFIDNLANEDQIKFLHSILAVDRIQSINYAYYIHNESLLKKIDILFLRALHLTLAGENKSSVFPRIIDQLFKRLKVKKNPNWQLPYEINSIGDGADCDIVHHALYGSWRNGEKHAVAIFSKERLGGWRNRCSRYLAAINFLKEMSTEFGDDFSLTPGIIFRVDDSGNIMDEVFDIKQEFDLSSFLIT